MTVSNEWRIETRKLAEFQTMQILEDARHIFSPSIYWHIVTLPNGQWSVAIKYDDGARSHTIAGPARANTLRAAVLEVVHEYDRLPRVK